MASLAYVPLRWGRRGMGATVSVAIHLIGIMWLLALRAPESSAPLPLNVTVIAAPEQAQTQPLEMLAKPRLSSPALHVPQPEIVLADAVAPAGPVVVPSAPLEQVDANNSAITQPVFDANYLNNPAPPYPPLARRLGEEGVVYVRILVSAEGLPDLIELKRSSGSSRLDAAALATVKKWRFVPARRSGQTIAAWVVVPVAFSLTA
ncbi:MAG TPA: energy transducer TonB [Spongiibacteraceae bacterium]|nr:energy transducer TonB [Spongiibacteraceae bacterium]